MYSVIAPSFMELAPDGQLVTARTHRHRRCRQYKIRHTYDPKKQKLHDKRMRQARLKRSL